MFYEIIAYKLCFGERIFFLLVNHEPGVFIFCRMPEAGGGK